MGSLAMKQIGIASALFSSVQGRVLALIFGHSDRSFYTSEIVRNVRSGTKGDIDDVITTSRFVRQEP
jgi:hypothetical protein